MPPPDPGPILVRWAPPRRRFFSHPEGLGRALTIVGALAFGLGAAAYIGLSLLVIAGLYP
ncbi:MAG TPA: hypothetical protein VEA79_05640 [Phenylobacterium sp.]|nr:hypothetical protein [Phenylobacterium sp.]